MIAGRPGFQPELGADADSAADLEGVVPEKGQRQLGDPAVVPVCALESLENAELKVTFSCHRCLLIMHESDRRGCRPGHWLAASRNEVPKNQVDINLSYVQSVGRRQRACGAGCGSPSPSRVDTPMIHHKGAQTGVAPREPHHLGRNGRTGYWDETDGPTKPMTEVWKDKIAAAQGESNRCIGRDVLLDEAERHVGPVPASDPRLHAPAWRSEHRGDATSPWAWPYGTASTGWIRRMPGGFAVAVHESERRGHGEGKRDRPGERAEPVGQPPCDAGKRHCVEEEHLTTDRRKPRPRR